MTHEIFVVIRQENILSLNLVPRTAEIKKCRTTVFPVVLNGREKFVSHTKEGA